MKNKLFTLTAALMLGLTVPVATISISSQTTQAATTSSTSSKNDMYTFIRSTLAKHHVRGSVVAVKDGKPQQSSYGYAWYGKRIGNGSSKVVYPTGSTQKVITGAMIVQLMNEKKNTKQSFSQNTKISRWYPYLRNAKNISVGNLLTHTSGITASDTEIDRGYNYSEANAINWVVNNVNAHTAGKVGSYFYNNTNYILLAGIIRQLTGKSYESNFNSRIVKKLGLKNTYLYQDIPSKKTDPISYYCNGGRNYQNPNYVRRTLASQLPGAGNMFTTPIEYYKIQVGLSNGQILNKDDFNYLTHLKSRVTDYSGGVYIKKNGTLKAAYGNLHGTHFGMWFQLTTDNQNGIVMFLNQTNDNENDEKAAGYDILQHIKKNTFTRK
ncbi:penicillin-binding protein [Lactobacillus acetotolerans]|uniref:Penicillin-binding protein n=3 Tax=Lactobacillus acetotolerans TaxID=1600 RepID=A0A0D6A0W6_9LACO|nr:penicillin-binding protein [Lactobacillus acetotolerans]